MRSEVKIGTVCNNNCVFCLNDEKKSSQDIKSIKERIKELARHGVNNIQFTGGEITIRKDCFSIIDFAKKKGLEVSIQSNGRAFYYTKFAKRTVDMGIESFLISLHAHNEELNRKITNTKNAHQQTVEGINNLLSFGQNVTINTVINSKNIDFLPEIIHHHTTLKPAMIQLSWVRPMGKALRNRTLIPHYAENKEKLIKSIEIAENNNQRIGIIGIPRCILPSHEKYFARPYLESAVIHNTNLAPAEAIFRQKMKTVIGECMKCDLLDECGGPFREYVKLYGNEEFKAQTRTEKILEKLKKGFDKNIHSINIVSRGFTSKNYSISKKGSLYFVKERKISDEQKEKEEKLKELFRKNCVPLLETIKTIENPPKTLEIYPFIHNIDSTKNISDNTIRNMAALLGKIYTITPSSQTNLDWFERAFLFANETSLLNTQEKHKIKQIKQRIDIIKKYLKTGLMHNDLHLGNVLIVDGKIKAITDFEKIEVNHLCWQPAQFLSSILWNVKEKKINHKGVEIFFDEYSKYVDEKELEAVYPTILLVYLDFARNSIKYQHRLGWPESKKKNFVIILKILLKDEKLANMHERYYQENAAHSQSQSM